MFKRIALALISILFVGSISAYAGMWSNFPIVGGASYCSATGNNSTCTNTVPAGPAKTGNETVPADTNASGGQSPQTALLSMADLNALPISFVVVTTPPAGISASNVSGGVVYTSTTTITSANITLPVSPVQGQTYRVASNRTITTLSVSAGAGSSMGGNTAPTVLTVSTTSPSNYTFIYNTADTSWYRLQ